MKTNFWIQSKTTKHYMYLVSKYSIARNRQGGKNG
jgi:hypothetical protein